MTEHGDTPHERGDGDHFAARDTEHDIRAAFESLRHDTRKVDTMAALRELEGMRRWVVPVALGGAVAAVLLLLGLLVLGGDDPDQNVATIDDGDATDTEAATESDGVGADDEVAEGDGDGTADEEAEGVVGRLGGTSWVLVEGTGPHGPIPLVEGWPVTMSIANGTVSGTAACNGYSGDVTIDDDGGFTVEELFTHLAGCEPAVEDSNSAFLAAFERAATVELDGDGSALVVSGPGIDLRFEPAAAVPQAELVGASWVLELLIDGDVATPAEGQAAELRLDPDGKLTAGTGCRDLSGEWVINGAEVLLTTFAADGVCRPALADQDGHVVTVLGDGFTAEIANGRLLLSSQGGLGLAYGASEGDGEGSASPDEGAGEDGGSEAKGGGDEGGGGEPGPDQAAAAVVLEGDGLGFVAPDSGSISRLPFGSPAGQVLDVLDRLLGEGERSPASPECPNQADRSVLWPDAGLQIELRGGELISWSLRPDSELTTLTGIGIGSTRAELGQEFVVELVDSTLGIEFTTGNDPGAPDAIRGLLSGRGNRATITDLWAGEICAFR